MPYMAEDQTAVLTVGDLYRRFGSMSVHRFVFGGPARAATEDDVFELNERERRRCELVDGILLEKAMGSPEAIFANLLAHYVTAFVLAAKSGLVFGDGALLRLAPGLVRIPDFCFVSWGRLPGKRRPSEAIVNFAPDLAVEVISPSNTPEEMDWKLHDYFNAGVRLVWYVYPIQREVHVFRSVEDSTVLRENDTLDGGDVLPGFSLSLATFFNSDVEPE